MCCRDHDHCKLSVEPGETKYGFKNNGLHTISSCQCDFDFRQCLERLNFWVANRVIQLYAYTNNECLYNLCDFVFARCPRETYMAAMSPMASVFEGIQKANDSNALNDLIRVGMENEKKSSDTILNERSHANAHPVPHFVPQHVQSNHYPDPFYPDPWQLQQIDSAAPIQGQVQYYNLPNQQQSDTICCVHEFQHL